MSAFWYHKQPPTKPKKPTEQLVEEVVLLSNHERGWNLTDIEEYNPNEWYEDEGGRPWIDLQGRDLKTQLDKKNISLNDVRFRVYSDYAGNICLEAQHLIRKLNPNYERELKQYEKDMPKYQEAYSTWEKERNKAEAEWNRREVERLEKELEERNQKLK